MFNKYVFKLLIIYKNIKNQKFDIKQYYLLNG